MIFRSLYNWTMKQAEHKNALWVLSVISFVESSFFPIPPDVFMIPMILAEREKAWACAFAATCSSVLGGVLGYAIGYFLYDTLGQQILDFYGYGDKFTAFQDKYNAYGIWIVFAAGLTPIPYKLITIASGLMQLNFFVFLLASVVSRAIRFYLLAFLLWRFGPPIRALIEKYLGLLVTLLFALIILGFMAFKYMMDHSGS